MEAGGRVDGGRKEVDVSKDVERSEGRGGMKRSSSENATNFSREAETGLEADQHVTKPWKQRFSFRQPRRQQADIQVLLFN